jgi:hypothetical protein
VLVAAVTGHDLHDLTLATGLADVRAFDDDPVPGLGMHGEPPLLSSPPLPSSLLIYSYRVRGADGTAENGYVSARARA